MDEESFHVFYEQTARGLRAYLRSMLTDRSFADDLLQESYFRLLKANLPTVMEPDHRKNYLYRIATNLVRDGQRSKRDNVSLEREAAAPVVLPDTRLDIRQAFDRLKPRERDLLWLAYVEHFDHREIAAMLRLRAASVRPLLSRARDAFSDMLKRRGLDG